MSHFFVESALKKYGDTVLRVANSITCNRADSEDVFSDVFFSLWQNMQNGKEFASDEHLKAWLVRVAINKAKNVVRLAFNKRRVELDNNIPFVELQRIEDSTVYEALGRLKPKDRAIMYLHYYEGYGHSEIAEMLGLRLSGVRSRVVRAREKLREVMSKE